MQIYNFKRLFTVVAACVSLVLTGCSNESSTSAATDDKSAAIAKIEAVMLPQCMEAFKIAIEMDKVDADTKTTDAICRCQVDTMIKTANVDEMAAQATSNNDASVAFEKTFKRVMKECADKYYVKLPL